jgi:predicted TIM-barrel fold metal-dependent hydrolase
MVATTKTMIVSADSHVTEPSELWSTRVPMQYRERAPHIELRDGRRYLIVEGVRPRRLDGGQASENGEQPRRAGGADIALRIRDMDLDGVAAEVIYPTMGSFIHEMPDAGLQLACATVYNDWAHDVFGQHFDRFMPAALIPVWDIETGVQELRRIARLGFRAAALPAHPPAHSYSDPAYEPLWASAQEASLALSFHVGGGRSRILERGAGGAVINYVYVTSGVQQTVAYLCASGVLERYPELHVAMVECGSGWLAWCLRVMDEAYAAHAAMAQPKLKLPPSEYFKRQGHVSFQYDLIGLDLLRYTGADCLIWGSDYPHPEGTWLISPARLAEQFAGLPDDVRRKITGETAARVYRFPLG